MDLEIKDITVRRIVTREIRKNADNYRLLKKINDDIEITRILNKKGINLTDEMIWDLWKYSQRFVTPNLLEKWCEEHSESIRDYLHKESPSKKFFRIYQSSIMSIAFFFISLISLGLSTMLEYETGIFISGISLFISSLVVMAHLMVWCRCKF